MNVRTNPYQHAFPTALAFFLLSVPFFAASGQTAELATAQTKLGRLWGGIAANGDAGTFNFTAGFFPNDFDILQYRGQTNDNFLGSGFKLACTNWKAPAGLFPNDSIFPVAVFGPKVSSNDIPNSDYVNGKVIVPLTNYVRFKYPSQTMDFKPIVLTDFGVYDPSKLDGTFDQLVEVTSRNLLGVEIHRKIMVWGQMFNDNYIIVDVELKNVGPDTLQNFYLWMAQGMSNNFYSNGRDPVPPASETPKYQFLWQHYYGARQGDSLRIFYFYNADDPGSPGDNMGSPTVSQHGRLLNSNFAFYTILHASQKPYINTADDIDDFLQPRVTYIGNETKIPTPDPSEDEYGSKSFWSIRGGFADRNRMSGSLLDTSTRHMVNNDELGTPDFSSFPAGDYSNNNQSRNMSSFGPYTFPPNQMLHIVYAAGVAGIGLKASDEVGRKWLAGTLEDPPNMPDPTTGWLPANFAFASGATEIDKRKDRWVSKGIDSMKISAWRAKWNYDHGYKIPQAPPPPDSLVIIGTGRGAEIHWSDPVAEAMPNFAGYRIMRRISAADTVLYEEVYSSGATDKANSHLFIDNTVILSAVYYYYVQAKVLIDANDPNADPSTRGEIMTSGRAMIPNITSVSPPGYSDPNEDLSNIRIVPNPYNINDPLLRINGYLEQRRINFFNLPGRVTIKIFSENGDLVKTIEHSSSVGSGFEPWDMITSSQQVISSGVYIAVFQKTNGQLAYQKFVVVR